MKKRVRDEAFLQSGLNVVDIESRAVSVLADRINADFVSACQLMIACSGRVVVTATAEVTC